jgi:DNA modification methylase
MTKHDKNLRKNSAVNGLAGTELVDIARLVPNDRNARTHNFRQIKKIAASIERFGFVNPVLIDAENGIVAGHGRVEAAKRLGLEKVPTLRVEHLSDADKRAYILADNRLAEDAGWDGDILAIELQGLIDLDVSIELTGFELAEVDRIIEGQGSSASDVIEDPADELVPVDEDAAPITKLGDLWELGSHRLYCGDATKPDSFETLLGNDQASLIFADPPYNVPISGHVCGLGQTQHREFAMASGEMSRSEFTVFLETVFGHMVNHASDGSIHFVCMDWRHIGETLAAGEQAYTELKNLCVWAKSNGGMGSFYRSRHELVFVFKSGTAPHINTFELGQTGRYRTNVWEYPGVNSFSKDRDDALEMHPTVKPVALVADAIRDCSKRRQIVLDPFGGSGTTLIAAEKTGRRARLLELDPRYCDTIIRRWQRLNGKHACHAESGKRFDTLETAASENSPHQDEGDD